MIHDHEGQLSINVSGPIAEIEIVDKKSGLYAFTLDISSEDLLGAIARRSSVDCRFWINQLGTVGSTREVKTELVPFDVYGGGEKHPKDTDPDGYRTPATVKALAPFEVDGWEARETDMWNGHCRVKEGGGVYQKVSFTRFLRDGVPIERRKG